MNRARREAVKQILCVAGALAVPAGVLMGQQPAPPGAPKPMPDPNQPDSNVPGGFGDKNDSAATTRAMLKANQKQMKEDVEKLYALASELKEQVEKTDSATVLSVSLVRRAEKIEKLAKQIKDRAKAG
jgi:hypothetical protein